MRARLVLAGLTIAAGIGLAACGTAATPAPQSPAAGLKVGQSSLGPIMTDQKGRTLYAFTKDHNGTSTCSGTCVATWPALTKGSTQVKFGNWPLYYYAGDLGPGDVDGQGVDGVWFAVNPNGKLIKTTGN